MARGPDTKARTPHRGEVKLDPQAEALLSLMAGSQAATAGTLAPRMLRLWMNESMKAFAARNVAVAGVRELSAPGPAGAIPMRVYTPIASGAGPLPSLVYFHGGAFLAGDLDTHDGLCRLLANETGAGVIAVAYRLAPEHRFPAAVEDACAAARWAAESARELGLDAARLAVGGDSAGGTLAAVVTQLARAEGRPAIRAQLLLYPMTQLDAETESRRAFAESFLWEEQALRRCADCYLTSAGEAGDPRISPLSAEDFARLPAAIIVTAGLDPFRDEAGLYADRLRAAGVEVQHLDFAGMFHGFLSACGVLDGAKAGLQKIAAALKAHLA